jgi:predicted secreted protein
VNSSISKNEKILFFLLCKQTFNPIEMMQADLAMIQTNLMYIGTSNSSACDSNTKLIFGGSFIKNKERKDRERNS